MNATDGSLVRVDVEIADRVVNELEVVSDLCPLKVLNFTLPLLDPRRVTFQE